jgi:hypothetical protein
MSMRETENEVNLLVPGTGLFEPALGHPAWSFAPPAEEPDEDEVPDADELGETSNG